MKTKPLVGKPGDTKGKYVRISKAAYEKIKAKADTDGRFFIKTLDILLGV